MAKAVASEAVRVDGDICKGTKTTFIPHLSGLLPTFKLFMLVTVMILSGWYAWQQQYICS